MGSSKALNQPGRAHRTFLELQGHCVQNRVLQIRLREAGEDQDADRLKSCGPQCGPAEMLKHELSLKRMDTDCSSGRVLSVD